MTTHNSDPRLQMWAAAQQREFVLPACANCGRVYVFPFQRCLACGGVGQLHWVDGPRSGTLHSWTTTHRPFHPQFKQIPYRIGLIELVPAPSQTVHYVSAMDANVADDELQIGAQVELDFAMTPDGRLAPVFNVPVRIN